MFNKNHGRGCRCASCQHDTSSHVTTLREMFNLTGESWPQEGTRAAVILMQLCMLGDDSWMSRDAQRAMAKIRKEEPLLLSSFFRDALA
jgi:hypothetical protein